MTYPETVILPSTAKEATISGGWRWENQFASAKVYKGNFCSGTITMFKDEVTSFFDRGMPALKNTQYFPTSYGRVCQGQLVSLMPFFHSIECWGVEEWMIRMPGLGFWCFPRNSLETSMLLEQLWPTLKVTLWFGEAFILPLMYHSMFGTSSSSIPSCHLLLPSPQWNIKAGLYLKSLLL